jgi:hypothetical protein
MSRIVAIFATVVFLVGTAQASVLIDMTFDPNQAPPPGGPGPNAPGGVTDVNGLSTLGVIFGFSSPTPGNIAMYGASTGGALPAPFSDPVLMGAADGTLTLTFLFPTTFLSFDIAYDVPTNAGGTVTVGGGAPDTISTFGPAGLAGLFSVGSYLSSAGSPFSSVTITFEPTAHSFAIDNLRFDAPTAGNPEPTSWVLLGTGVLLLGASRFRRPTARK